jgi:hypothetical protein
MRALGACQMSSRSRTRLVFAPSVAERANCPGLSGVAAATTSTSR